MHFLFRPTRRDSSQHGQVLVIFALMAITLVGASALAVDLSGQSYAHRNIQNWTDSAALAGARDCVSTCSAKTEVQDAITGVLLNSPWSSTPSWATSAPTGGCTTSSCVVTNYPGPAGFTNFTISASSPPAKPRNSSYNTKSYVEVDINQVNQTSLEEVIAPSNTTTTSVGHSIAYSSGPPSPYGYTFYSKKEAGSGNQIERIVGDTYVGNGYNDQSNGQSALCVEEVTLPAGAAPDGDPVAAQDNDVDDQGHVVFGVIPPTIGPEPTYGPAFSCPSKSGGGALLVQQTSPNQLSFNNCPPTATATKDGSTGIWLCVEANPGVPDIVAPPKPWTAIGCNGTIDNHTSAGVYSVTAGCVVNLSFKNGDINCVSLVLAAGSSVNVIDKKSQDYMTSYGFTADAVALAAINNLTPQPSAPAACPGSGDPRNNTVIWAPDPGSSSTPPTALSNQSTGCCSDTLFIGTVFLPNQSIDFATNQAMEDVGSIYVGNWDIQAGNHPNPAVTYDNAASAPVQPSLRLAE